MKKILVLLSLAVLLVAGSAFAQLGPFVVWEFPKMTEPPELDGVRGEAEWAGANQSQCSPSQVERDAADYGWLNQDAGQSNRGINQLLQGDEEEADEAKTDADITSNFWLAWDEDGIYYIHEVRDNFHDTTQDAGGNPLAWWERDSVSLYIDLTNSNVGGGGELYESMNIVNTLAEPQASSNVTVTFVTIEAGARVDTQDPDVIEGIEYGYREAGDEFGGEADYVLEAMVEWDTFMQFNLPETPTVGSVMGIQMLLPDPDIAPGWNGQIQCMGSADYPSSYDDFVFSDNPAGPGAGTPVESDSWGRIKSTFNN